MSKEQQSYPHRWVEVKREKEATSTSLVFHRSALKPIVTRLSHHKGMLGMKVNMHFEIKQKGRCKRLDAGKWSEIQIARRI